MDVCFVFLILVYSPLVLVRTEEVVLDHPNLPIRTIYAPDSNFYTIYERGTNSPCFANRYAIAFASFALKEDVSPSAPTFSIAIDTKSCSSVSSSTNFTTTISTNSNQIVVSALYNSMDYGGALFYACARLLRNGTAAASVDDVAQHISAVKFGFLVIDIVTWMRAVSSDWNYAIEKGSQLACEAGYKSYDVSLSSAAAGAYEATAEVAESAVEGEERYVWSVSAGFVLPRLLNYSMVIANHTLRMRTTSGDVARGWLDSNVVQYGTDQIASNFIAIQSSKAIAVKAWANASTSTGTTSATEPRVVLLLLSLPIPAMPDIDLIAQSYPSSTQATSDFSLVFYIWLGCCGVPSACGVLFYLYVRSKAKQDNEATTTIEGNRMKRTATPVATSTVRQRSGGDEAAGGSRETRGLLSMNSSRK